VIVLVAAFTICWGRRLDASYANDYDEGVYLVTARLALHGHRLFRELFSSQPPFFSRLLLVAFGLFGDTVEVGRAVSVVSAVVLGLALARLAARLFSPWAAPLAALLWGTSASAWHAARTVQAEMPALSLAVLAAVLVPSKTARLRGARYVAVGASFGLALLTKVFVVAYLPLLVMLAMHFEGTADWRFVLRQGALAGVGLAAVVALVVVPCGVRPVVEDSILLHLKAQDVGGVGFGLGGLAVVFARADPLLLGMAAFGSWTIRAQRSERRSMLAWMGGVAAFLALHRPLYIHHLVLLVPVLATVGSAAVAMTTDFLHRRQWVAVLALILLCGDRWARLLRAPAHPDHKAEALVALLRVGTTAEDQVVTDDQMLVFRAGRDPPPTLCDTSNLRILSGSLRDDMVIRAAESAPWVVIRTGRLTRLHGFVKWLKAHYEEARPGLYLRRDPAPR
jgi:4-amino-4-deoxy-L-arabinose transferase-like glycosyltransferase